VKETKWKKKMCPKKETAVNVNIQYKIGM
jgi:hypothetical protein